MLHIDTRLSRDTPELSIQKAGQRRWRLVSRGQADSEETKCQQYDAATHVVFSKSSKSVIGFCSPTTQISHEALEALFEPRGIRRHTPTQEFGCFAAERRTGRDADTGINHQILTKRQAIGHSANAKEGVHPSSGSHAKFNAIDCAKTRVERVAVCFDLAHQFVNILIA